MVFLKRLAERYLWIVGWLRSRQSLIDELQGELERERKAHRDSVAKLESDLALRDREIEGLLQINARDRARVEAETAILVARRQRAITNPKA